MTTDNDTPDIDTPTSDTKPTFTLFSIGFEVHAPTTLHDEPCEVIVRRLEDFFSSIFDSENPDSVISIKLAGIADEIRRRFNIDPGLSLEFVL